MGDLIRIKELPPITIEMSNYRSFFKTKGFNITVKDGITEYHLAYTTTYKHFQHNQQYERMRTMLPDEVCLMIISKVTWWLAKRLYQKKQRILWEYETGRHFFTFWEAIKQPDLEGFYSTYRDREDFIDFPGEEPIRFYPVDEPKKQYTLIKKNEVIPAF